jgi:hypothetical protein
MGIKKRPAKRAVHRVKAPTQVQRLINGQPAGIVSSGDMTIGQAASDLARDNGLKTYSILVNGTKVTTEGASKRLAGAATLEVFAKETRGKSVTYGLSKVK